MKRFAKPLASGLALLVSFIVLSLTAVALYAGLLVPAGSGDGQAVGSGTVAVAGDATGASASGGESVVSGTSGGRRAGVAVLFGTGADAAARADALAAAGEAAGTAGSHVQDDIQQAPDSPQLPVEAEASGGLAPLAGSLHASDEAGLIDAIDAATDSGESTTIVLENDIETTQDISIPSGANITLVGDSELKRMNDGATLTIASGATLVLDGITVTHDSSATGSGVVVNGSLHLLDGLIRGNRVAGIGGGISVAQQAVFTMSGGTVSGNGAGNIGGGISVAQQAVFTMSGGTVSDNVAGSGGGIYVGSEGIFTMTEGAVINNRAEGSSYSMGGGISNGGGIINIVSGSISENKAVLRGGGIYNDSVYFTADTIADGSVLRMSGGVVSGNEAANGGGVWNGGFFFLEGGEIRDNSADSGGGVFNQSIIPGEFAMSGGTISGNTAAVKGGGVANNSNFTMSGGAITGNIALAEGNGGGVWNHFELAIVGGTVSGNKAGNGGGIYLYSSGNSSAVISGAAISGNTAVLDGGGIWVGQARLDTLSIAYDVVFSSNSAAVPYDRKPADDGIYATQVQCASWTSPFSQGYNNYDISYEGLAVSRSVSVAGSRSVSPGTGSYGFGATVEVDAGDNPGHAFSGWTVDAGGAVLVDAASAKTSFVMPAADVALTAGWDPLPPVTYTISYAPGTHGSGIVPSVTVNALDAHTVAESAFVPNPGYTFDGWDVAGAVTGSYAPGDVITVTGDITLTARWSAIPTFTVTFVDFDNTVLKAQIVIFGAAATAPADPVRQGYTFTGWDKAFTNVTSDLTVTATYTPIAPVTHTVTFVDFDGTVLDEQTVISGADATAPADPVRQGFTFTGWDKAFTNVTADLTVTATYTAIPPVTYTISYAPGTHGSGIVPSVTVNALDAHTVAEGVFVANPGWEFDGWEATGALTGSYTPGATITVTGDITLTARWAAIPTFTVTFVDLDNTVLKAQIVISGADATAPADPARVGFTFTGWDKPFDNVTTDLTVTATYTALPPVTHTVTFVDFDGTVLKEQTVAKGTDATAPQAPVRQGFTFTGWDKAFTNVTADLTVTATYTAIPPVTYTISYAPGTHGSGIVPSITLSALAAHTVAENVFVPTPGYTFDGWDVAGAVTGSYAPGDVITVTGDITLTARWAAIPTFTVTFVDFDNTVLKAQIVISGADATAPTDPVRQGFTFTGWDKAFANVTTDLTVTATYTPIAPVTYTVTFVDYDGTVLDTQVITEGDSATAPADPVRQGYTFTGWDKAFTNVTTDLTATATYTAIPPVTYTISYTPGTHGLGIMPAVVATQGTTHTVAANGFASSSGYTFTGWDATGAATGIYSPGDSITVTGDITLTARWAAPQPTSHTVTFTGWDNTVLKSVAVPAGATATPPVAPARQGFIFTGWDGPLTNISKDTVLRATYVLAPSSSGTFTVVFAPGAHGAFTPQETAGLPSGIATPTAPQPTAVQGWRFTGWYPAVAPVVTRDVTYTAQWESLADDTSPAQPPIIINSPAAPVPNRYVTVSPSTPQAAAAQPQQDSSAAAGSPAGTATATEGTGTTNIADGQTPLADDGTGTAGDSAGSSIAVILSALLFLCIISVVGWLLLRTARY